MREIIKHPRVGVGVMIIKDKKVLLGKRHNDPIKADSELRGQGSWTMPGGKLNYMETPEDCIYRETYEETGIKLDINRIKFISVTNDTAGEAHFITLGFMAEDFKGEPQIKEPNEIVEWQWFDLNKLPIPLYTPSYKILKNYLDNKMY